MTYNLLNPVHCCYYLSIINHNIRMNRLTLRVQKLWKAGKEWQKDLAPRVELWIDKYKLIKVGCVTGIGIYLLSKL